MDDSPNADPGDRTSIHPWWLRAIHWCNAAAIVLLIMSGWRIYDATNFLHILTRDSHGNLVRGIPRNWTLGGWLGGALQWHFAAMWILFGTTLLYLIMVTVTKRFTRQFLPVSIPGIFRDLLATFTGKLSHADLRHYNFVQKAAYLFAMLDIIVLICSGLVLFKSVQFPILRTLLGGYETARYIHFIAMLLLVGFILVHVVMALLVPKTIKAMLWGR